MIYLLYIFGLYYFFVYCGLKIFFIYIHFGLFFFITSSKLLMVNCTRTQCLNELLDYCLRDRLAQLIMWQCDVVSFLHHCECNHYWSHHQSNFVPPKSYLNCHYFLIISFTPLSHSLGHPIESPHPRPL